MLSYIKPQRLSAWLSFYCVVYQCFPTSNHNALFLALNYNKVVYQCFPTSNHNRQTTPLRITTLFTNAFLHQTTTPPLKQCLVGRCLPMLSYIKPQRKKEKVVNGTVVYQCFPTSNHNIRIFNILRSDVVYQCFPTSNHN